MPQPTLPAEGGCRCGKLRFRVTAPPLMTLACHCRGCQRMTASAFSLTAMVPEDGFGLIAGEPVIGGLHGDGTHHWHCGWCLSWTHTTLEPAMSFINVRATMLDDIAWFSPFAETMAAEKLAWVDLPVRHSFAGFPPPERYGSLLAEFAAL